MIALDKTAGIAAEDQKTLRQVEAHKAKIKAARDSHPEIEPATDAGRAMTRKRSGINRRSGGEGADCRR